VGRGLMLAASERLLQSWIPCETASSWSSKTGAVSQIRLAERAARTVCVARHGLPCPSALSSYTGRAAAAKATIALTLLMEPEPGSRPAPQSPVASDLAIDCQGRRE
jgi:hypothetical protein